MKKKSWIITAINALTEEREPVSQRVTFEDAMKICKREIRRGPGRAHHDPRPEPVQLTFDS